MKSAVTDLLREMIDFAAERLMILGMSGLTGGPYGQKSAERLVQHADHLCECESNATSLRCHVHFMRTGLAHSGRSG